VPDSNIWWNTNYSSRIFKPLPMTAAVDPDHFHESSKAYTFDTIQTVKALRAFKETQELIYVS